MEKLDWRFIAKKNLTVNLNAIAMETIRLIVQGCPTMDESEKVAEIDGIISLVDAVAESMEGDEDA